MTKILVPLDGSSFAAAALPVAERLARQMQAEVVLLTVGTVTETPVQEKTEESRLQQRHTHEQRERLRGLVIHERTDTRGDPVHGILDAISDEEVDLVVMATHARSGLSALAKGSVADEVVRSANVPVTLVNPGD